MPELTESEKAIFRVAVSLTDASERDKFVRQACGKNELVLRQLEKLLSADDAACNFLSTPAGMSGFADNNGIFDTQCEQIGRYKLLQKIGEGGFGIVYMAEQQQPVIRKVALKIIKLGMDTKQVVARFEAERQALAMMDHPNIAKVFDGGATETGRPYFVMELVRGIPVVEFCDQKRLPNEHRLLMFADICGAIQHAHQKGIIHRDLKPTNILVTLHDGQPVPKVIDFGIAKATQGRLTDKTLFTRFEQFIGTPAYMSPEQAEMSGHDIDTRSDIYSLGVLLYELLTGQIPFDRKELTNIGFDEMRRRIREHEPPTPSTRLSSLQQDALSKVAKNRHTDPAHLSGLLRGELDWVVMKAMEKDRSRRYETASAFAEDIHRYLREEAVLAVPPTTMYRFRKFTRRNRASILVLGCVAAILIVTTAISTSLAILAINATGMARSEKNRALSAEKDAEEKTQLAIKSEANVKRNLYVAEMATAKREFDMLNTQRTVELVDRNIPGPNENDSRGFEWRWLWNECNQDQFQLIGHNAKLRDLRFSPDGKWLVTGAKDGTARLWDMETKREVWHFQGGFHCNRVDISPDGQLLLTEYWISPEQNPNNLPNAILWDISDMRHPKELRRIREAERFSLDGDALFVISRGKKFDLSGKLIGQIPAGEGNSSDGNVWLGALRYSRDGKTAVTIDEIWDVPNGLLVGKLPQHHGYQDHGWGSAAISPRNNVIVTGCANGARVWDRQGNLLRELPVAGGPPLSGIDFSRDGDLVAVRQALGAIRVFDTETWTLVASFRLPSGNTVAFSPAENNLLVAGGEDGVVRGWRVFPENPIDPVLDHSDEVLNLKFSPNGRMLAVGMKGGAVRFWDLRTRKEVLSTPHNPSGDDWLGRYHSYRFDMVALSPDNRFAAIIGPKEIISVWDIEQKVRLQELTYSDDLPKELHKAYWSVEFSRDCACLYAGVTVGESGLIEVWEWTNDGTMLRRSSQRATQWIRHRSMASSPRSDLLVTTGGFRITSENRATCSLWKLPGMQKPTELTAPASAMLNLAFSRDGTRLAISSDPAAVTLWDTATWQQTATLPHSMAPEHISWSPDGNRIAVSGPSQIVKLWDVHTEQVVATYRGQVAAFSPDGTILAVAGELSEYIGDEKPIRRVTLHYAPPLKEIDRLRVSR